MSGPVWEKYRERVGLFDHLGDPSAEAQRLVAARLDVAAPDDEAGVTDASVPGMVAEASALDDEAAPAEDRLDADDDPDGDDAEQARPRKRHVRRLGPYSAYGAIAGLDARSREWRYLEKCRQDLAAYCNGTPSPIQTRLIERCAVLQLRLSMLDRRILENDGVAFTNQDNLQFCAWSNALSRTLALLQTVTHGYQPRGKKGQPRFMRNKASVDMLRAAAAERGATVADLLNSS
jgi:hypothetical protein